jgi:hemerythrin-like metal-binding protein
LAAQLLAFARKQTLFPETVAVGPLLAEMRELLCRAAAEANDLQIRCASDVWAILIDPTQLESALLNLVINARDAVPASGGTIVITAENARLNLATAARLQVPPGEFVRIVVADNGGGIAPEMLERVFDPFFTTKELGKGSGIGLAQVHGLVAQSGGAIDIESESGRGTSVAMLLPRAPWAIVERTTDASLADMAGNGQCVLLVEDQEDLRATARMMLEEHGYRVVEAADAQAARTIMAGTEVISVLFADLVLPFGESGLELARVAQQLRPDIRVLLTSGYTKDVLDQFGVQAREFEFLLKPYSTRKLSARISRLRAGAVPAPLRWSAAHEVGIRVMDEQHARLAELLNDLAAVVKSGEDHTAVLNDIISYTEFHFAAEAQLMATHDYRDCAAHTDAHRRLLEEIRAFRPGIDGASARLALHYLQDWLLGHVRGHDRELAEALRAQGMR